MIASIPDSSWRDTMETNGHTPLIGEQEYQGKIGSELAHFTRAQNTSILPPIFHYWSCCYLLPKLYQLNQWSALSLYVSYMLPHVYKNCAHHPLHILSIGTGSCDLEIQIAGILNQWGAHHFRIDCVEVNPALLARGKESARKSGLENRVNFIEADINSWKVEGSYQIVLANQSLHHILELEHLFAVIHEILTDDGTFVTDDMIGRNGHMRWPEALEQVNLFWKELPDRYHYNHLLNRNEPIFQNWDCSQEGFEGIRAQDILRLLLSHFHFDFFLGYANIIDVFIDRCFGYNFEITSQSDRAFIDRIHQVDEVLLEEEKIKPTHMLAAMTKKPLNGPTCYKHMTPSFCLRECKD